MSIGVRLKQWRTHKDLKQEDASALLGVPFSTYQKYEMDNRKPGADAMEAFVHAGINTNWLLTGEGDMLLSNGKALQQPQGHYHARLIDLNAPGKLATAAAPDDFALVPVYDVQASAGHGSVVESEPKTGHLAFRRDWLRDKGLEVAHLAIITAKGDSMEPTISDGDILLIDTSVDKIIDDTLYIVQAEHHLIVKRIQQALDGTLIIISDNQRYEKQTISPKQAKEVKIAGRVRWYGHEI